MEKLALMNLLYDFYGQLLTERQRKYMELYYSHDLSLGEIAEQFGVSRQAVYDVLKRSEQLLETYEEKLGLVEKHQNSRRLLEEAVRLLDGGAAGRLTEVKNILARVMAAEDE